MFIYFLRQFFASRGACERPAEVGKETLADVVVHDAGRERAQAVE